MSSDTMDKASEAIDKCRDVCAILDYKDRMEKYFTDQIASLQDELINMTAIQAAGTNPYTMAALIAQQAATAIASIQSTIAEVQSAQTAILAQATAKINELSQGISDPVAYCKNR